MVSDAYYIMQGDIWPECAKMIFELIIMPILTYSSTTKTSFNNTQLQKCPSLERRATKVIGYELNQWKSIKW